MTASRSLLALILAGLAVRGALAEVTTMQDAALVLSAPGFNSSGGPLLFNHPSGLATDGTRLLLCDRFNNRVLVWTTLPTAFQDAPDLVLGQPGFDTNDSGSGRGSMNFPGNVSAAASGAVAVADTENDRIMLWRQAPTGNGQQADVLLNLPVYSVPGGNRYEWPWGVWTNGTKLAAVATQGAALLVWNTLPLADDAAPSDTIKASNFGTPRNFTTDGATYLMVGDHNARNQSNQSGTFCWNRFPTGASPEPDFFITEWIKGTVLPDSRFIAGGLADFYLWNSLPTSAAQGPAVTMTHANYKNGDGPDIVHAGGKTWINSYNGNTVLVYDGIPDSTSDQPEFALGTPDPTHNTLEDIPYIQNPVLETDGSRLVATSDFDRQLWIWSPLPTASGQAPTSRTSLQAQNLMPWDNALHDGHFVAAGMRTVAIWDSLPDSGGGPSRVFNNQVGTAQFQELRGVALDSQGLYLADRNGSLWIWNGIPANASTNPVLTVSMPATYVNRLHSDGEYLCAARLQEPPGVVVYKVADLRAGNTTPFYQLSDFPNINLTSDARTFSGTLVVSSQNGNCVYAWAPGAWGNSAQTVLLGQPSFSSREPGTGRNLLFMPGSVCLDASRLWVGEFKFSSRILRYDRQQATGGHAWMLF